MDSKKTFWIIAAVVALAGVAATVAYFVTRYMNRDDYAFDCDCDELYDYDDLDELDACECDCGCDCDCDCESDAE